jgi:4-aminobutyrate aminotransferase/(S)-3-amino-2-methylpropionate transaminase
MTNSERLLKEREENVPPPAFNVTPLFAERAEGAMITDVDGRQYIDVAAGIGVLNVGHRPRD